MLFYKKVLLLKEVTDGFSEKSSSANGIFRLEQEDGLSTISLTLVGIKKLQGEYRLFIAFDKKTFYSFPLGARPFSFTDKVDFFPPVDTGFSVGLVFVKDCIPTVVCFARTENAPLLLKDFKKIVIDKCVKEREDFAVYDDEVVATENYYDDIDLTKKIEIIKNLDTSYVQNKDALFNSLGKIQAQKDQTNAYRSQNEKDDCTCKSNQNPPYYLTVKKELDDLFSRFPEEETLNRLSVNGKWVKVDYSPNKFYVVGVLYEENAPKYICYGVPSKYSIYPPKELLGFASFVPKSVFDLKGDGYFIMFQDAVTGKSIKINS